MASPLLAAIFSFFIPGLGQFYDGHFLRGAIIFVGLLILGAAAAVLWVTLILGALLSLFIFLIWAWNIYDAYQLAK
ncbi:hypothetical protein [Methanolapillus millepedarum]|uniref:TM2 domain-containing protein n=1 Tax=Methanolapillus millepedarum TaxID=3028296 RepID=A0AA96V224_9EURY|nr:hypothetical protein MsAc7_05340 [Methanosarcinaceae archaeon Ac7]